MEQDTTNKILAEERIREIVKEEIEEWWKRMYKEADKYPIKTFKIFPLWENHNEQETD